MTTPSPLITTPSGKVERKASSRWANSELRKLKSLWRDQFTEDQRRFWRDQFVSPDLDLPGIRRLIRDLLKIDLKYDRQLYYFRAWDLTQRGAPEASCTPLDRRTISRPSRRPRQNPRTFSVEPATHPKS